MERRAPYTKICVLVGLSVLIMLAVYRRADIPEMVSHMLAPFRPAKEEVVPKDHRTFVDQLPEVPAFPSSSGLLAKADWAHDAVFVTVQKAVADTDERLSDPKSAKERVPVSRFRIGLYGEVVMAETAEFAFEPEFEIELETPNTTRRLSVFLTTIELDDLPGSDPVEKESELRVGLRRTLLKRIKVDAGIRWDWPPDPFVRTRWSMKYQWENWEFHPGMQAYWRLNDGPGGSAVISCSRWFGRRFFRSSTGARLVDDREKSDWSQSFLVGYAHEFIDESYRGWRADWDDMARCLALHYRLTGDIETGKMETQECWLLYKSGLRRKWAYLVISPGVILHEEREWVPEPGIRVGLDMLFWNIGDR